MTAREHRLSRLVTLRTKMHDVATLDLRAANGAFAKADDAVQRSLQHSINARQDMCERLIQYDQHAWLLACADAELSKLDIVNNTALRAQAAETVKTAAAWEAGARRERKQMEVTLESLREKEQMVAVRTEQQTLDETSRLLSAASSKSPFSRRTA